MTLLNSLKSVLRSPSAIPAPLPGLMLPPLATTIAEAHKRGLKVHAWLNTSLLANLDALPTDPKHVYNKHPEWLAVPDRPANGNRVEQLDLPGSGQGPMLNTPYS